MGFIFSSCEKKDYPAGLTELEHHYYALFVPNNNTAVTVSRSQTALLKFPVQFYSTFTRDYDAVAKYAVVTGLLYAVEKISTSNWLVILSWICTSNFLTPGAGLFNSLI